MSSKILLLALGSHDLSQPGQIHSKWSWVSQHVDHLNIDTLSLSFVFIICAMYYF
jgi:hypothetical protein